MTTVKLKIKINNSYESEPSSGSGSSASDYDNLTSEKAVSNIHHLMFNPNYCTITNVQKSAEKITSPDTDRLYPSDVGSSQESIFEGFTDYQIEERTVTSSRKPRSKYIKRIPPLPTEQTSDTYKKIIRLYDVLIEQNSCNAVDMQLSNRNNFETLEVDEKFSNNPTELSFNGKIKSLTATPVHTPYINQNTMKSPKILKAALEMNETSNYKYTNERSPDLFEDDDDDDGAHEVSANVTTDGADKSINCPTESSFAEENTDGTNNEPAILLKKNIKREKELLKRMKTCLSGIPPPPSLTIPQLDLFTAITKNKEEILNFNSEVETVGSIILCEEEGIFKPTHPLYEVMEMPWKDTLGVRGHGLCYNLCKASESIELLSLAVIDRFIGAETSTSYTANVTSSPSSAKKRNLRQKMLTQSSGTNRLSHLAKRRAAFSSANLATSLQKPQSSSLGGMQILLDKKKGKSRRKGTTPKRMTPSSKKKAGRKTPSSSARKRLFFRFDATKPGPSRETSKRALFQSPAKQKLPAVCAPKPTLKPEIANRVEKSKRALFSPDKTSQCSQPIQSSIEYGSFSQSSQSSLFGSNLDFLTLKRKRTDDDISDYSQQIKKAYRTESQSVTPRSLKIKSQSFCIGAGSTNSISGSISSSNTLRSKNSSNTSIAPPSNNIGRPIVRAFSDTTFHSTNLLTENHRKKLLWAVSQALQAKQINVTHGNFKQFASVLARVVRRLFQEFFLKSNSSTSDTMLRLSKKYVCNVIAGKSADEIYLYAKSKIDEEKRLSSTRLSGYIAPNEFETRQAVLSQTSLWSFENSMDMFGLSQNSSICLTQPSQSQQRNPENVSLDNSNSKSAIKLSIQPNASLQNSSSKNNLGGIALRENVDCEQRRSAQKNFTGIDQRNVSPYACTAERSANKSISFKSSLYGLNSSTAKAKRQISFDS